MESACVATAAAPRRGGDQTLAGGGQETTALEFHGALYHVTSRGGGKESIFLDDDDRIENMDVLGEVVSRFNWVIHAYCLMGNHHHLLVETPDGNLVLGMRHYNGVYTQCFNRRHGRVGHVFQGRYEANIVQKES